MSRRQANYGPSAGPVPGGQYQMQGPGYQAMQYGGYSGGYSNTVADMYDGSYSSYPTPVSRILHC